MTSTDKDALVPSTFGAYYYSTSAESLGDVAPLIGRDEI